MENNYKITPLTVEISVLKIGKKQCTIAVFKQLKEQNLYWERANDIEIWGRSLLFSGMVHYLFL